MKKFWKDYAELLDASLIFFKNHWLGTIITSMVCGIIGWFTPEIIVSISDKIEERRIKKETKTARKEV